MPFTQREPGTNWQRFRVGSPGTKAKPSWDCEPLTKVYHIAHLEPAHRIIVEGKVRSGLVRDESKLNKERILVTWLSPNFWRDGFRYGSIRFIFDWPTLCQGHCAYWVESIRNPRRGEACRILLTKNDHSKSDLLIPYDPKVGDGPWWFDEASGNHYWNGRYCLEFMVEHDIETSEVRDLDYVNHHKLYCSDPECHKPDDLNESLAGGRFLARLAASNLKLPSSALDKADNTWEHYVRRAIGRILKNSIVEFNGDLAPENPGSPAIARALLNADNNPLLHGDIPYLVSLFHSRKALEECCLSLIRTVVRK